MTAVNQGSYQFERLEGRQREAAFLQERAQMRLEGFSELLDRHCKKRPESILEVGCGQGIRTTIMAEKYPNAAVLGVDRSAELLNATRDKTAPNLRFEQADIYNLPYAADSFDLVYARLVFMHLIDPLKALSELQRVLRPGGSIVIEDADRDCMFFEPAPASFSLFWAKVQSNQRRLGGDPNIGRKLAMYLKQVGFGDVTTECQPLTGGKDEIEFLARTLMPSLNIYLPPEERTEGERAIADLTEMAQNPAATFYHFWFVVSGIRQ